MADEQPQPQKETIELKPGTWRQIIIETDGTEVNLKLAQVAGKIELLAVLQAVMQSVAQAPTPPPPPTQPVPDNSTK